MRKKDLDKIITSILFFSLIPMFSFAQDEWPGWVEGEEGRVIAVPRITFATAVYRFANLLFYLTAFLALIFIIYAAIVMVTAQGDPGKIEQAKTIIMYAVVALAIAVIAYGLVSLLIQYLTGGRTGAPGGAGGGGTLPGGGGGGQLPPPPPPNLLR